MDLPATLTSRPFTRDDVPAVTQLVADRERHFLGEPFADEADLRSQWAMPGVDLAADTIGVFAGHELVGRAELTPTGYTFVDVAPDRRASGLGSALLDWTIDLARHRSVERIEQYVPTPDVEAIALLESRGFEAIYVSWILRLAPGVDIHHRDVGPDVVVRPFRSDDAEAVFQIIEDAFNEWENRRPRTFAEWSVENLEREGADTDGFRVAVRAGEIVGACIVHDYAEASTFVHQLAVRNDLRGLGLGQELLADAFEAARHRGRPIAELSTDTRTGALGLYERLGMRTIAEFTTFKKTVEA